jgi:hypothetical protein
MGKVIDHGYIILYGYFITRAITSTGIGSKLLKLLFLVPLPAPLGKPSAANFQVAGYSKDYSKSN